MGYYSPGEWDYYRTDSRKSYSRYDDCARVSYNPCKEVSLGKWAKSPFIEEKEEKKEVSKGVIPIQVRFYSDYRHKYDGKSYSYLCDEGDAFGLCVGDVVVVPANAQNTPTVVEVVEIGNDPHGYASKKVIQAEFADDIIEFPQDYDYSFLIELLEKGVDELVFEGERYFLTELVPKDMIPSLKSNKENDNMSKIQNTIADSLFRKVDNVVLDLQTGSLGVKNGSATVTYRDGMMSENPLNFFDMEFPAFAMSTLLSDIKTGDIIVNAEGKAIGWITDIYDTEGAFQVQNAEGMTTKYKPSTNTMMGGQRTMVVKNFFGDAGFGGIQGMMVPLMLMNGGSVDGNSEKMFQMLMLQSSGLFGGAMGGDNNNMMGMMLPMMMMKNLF